MGAAVLTEVRNWEDGNREREQTCLKNNAIVFLRVMSVVDNLRFRFFQ